MKFLLNINIDRLYKGLDYTIGKLNYIGYDETNNIIEQNHFLCNTLEDVVRNLDIEEKVSGRTAIPAGKYETKMSFSNKFQRVLPILLHVPHFTGIRIHRGNTHEHTEGCILVGENTKKGMITRSAFYEKQICELISLYKHCYISICNA